VVVVWLPHPSLSASRYQVGVGDLNVIVVKPQLPLEDAHIFSPLTKYLVVLLTVGVIELPVPTKVPPQLPVYHFHAVASLSVPEAVSVTEEEEHRVDEEAVMLGMVG
jgi:hypothetical protein